MTREMTTIEDARRQWDERFASAALGTDGTETETETEGGPRQKREPNPEAVRVLYQQLHLTNGFLLGVTPSENDVIFTSADDSGRNKVGGNVVLSDEDHPGNRYFLEVLEAARKTYLTSVEGDELCWDVIHEILKRGGRFLIDAYYAYQPFEVGGFLGMPQFDPLRDLDEPAEARAGPDNDVPPRRGRAGGGAAVAVAVAMAEPGGDAGRDDADAGPVFAAAGASIAAAAAVVGEAGAAMAALGDAAAAAAARNPPRRVPDDEPRRLRRDARLERIMERRRLIEARGGGGGGGGGGEGGGGDWNEGERIHQLEGRRMMRAMHVRQRRQRRNDVAEQQDDFAGLFHRNGNENDKTPINLRWATEICKDQLKNVANPYTSYACALELVQVVFSDEDKAKFQAWASTTPVLVPHEEDLSILSRYEPFRAMCNTVDSASSLYPLQRAIQIGLEWDEGVKQIFEACDEIVRFPDPEYGLLPFQLAAATEDASVDLTYNLLKACPELVWQKLLNPNDMKYSPEFFTGYVIAEVPEEYLEQREKEEDIDWDNVEYEYTSTEESSHALSCDEDSDVED